MARRSSRWVLGRPGKGLDSVGSDGVLAAINVEGDSLELPLAVRAMCIILAHSVPSLLRSAVSVGRSKVDPSSALSPASRH